MHTSGGRYHHAATGDFYGYPEYQAELRRSGRRASTGSDSEIALHLYAESGPRALDRLRGEFAFVIWDERDGELFAARDRFGIKPLYYAHHRGRLYLSSEIKALLAAGVPARWDRAPPPRSHALSRHPPGTPGLLPARRGGRHADHNVLGSRLPARGGVAGDRRVPGSPRNDRVGRLRRRPHPDAGRRGGCLPPERRARLDDRGGRRSQAR